MLLPFGLAALCRCFSLSLSLSLFLSLALSRSSLSFVEVVSLGCGTLDFPPVYLLQYEDRSINSQVSLVPLCASRMLAWVQGAVVVCRLLSAASRHYLSLLSCARCARLGGPSAFLFPSAAWAAERLARPTRRELVVVVVVVLLCVGFHVVICYSDGRSLFGLVCSVMVLVYFCIPSTLSGLGHCIDLEQNNQTKS